MTGHVWKRCPCPREAGAPRKNCPKRHGTWVFQHDLPRGEDGRRRQVKAGGFRTREDALEALAQSLGRVVAGERGDARKITVAAWLDEWLSTKVALGEIRPSTQKSYREHVAQLRPLIGSLRLVDLTTTARIGSSGSRGR